MAETEAHFVMVPRSGGDRMIAPNPPWRSFCSLSASIQAGHGRKPVTELDRRIFRLPRTQSADELFTHFKEQNYVELSHHQWKSPLAVRPLFLKSPRRVEALVCLMQLALTAYQLLERFYRQSVPAGAAEAEQRLTAESLLREFRSYGLIEKRTRLGRVVEATRLSERQRQILHQLGFPTPAQLLAQVLPPLPHTG